MIGRLQRLLRYGLSILGLAMICPTFWLFLGVTLAGLSIGVSLVCTAVERYVLKTRSRRLKGLAVTAAIVLYFGVALVLTHYWVISGLNDASAMACHGILDRRSVIVCHADVLPPHRRLTIIEEADMKLQSPLPHWGHQSGRTRATP